MSTKACRGPCGRELPNDRDHFEPAHGNGAGLRNVCKDCRNVAARARIVDRQQRLEQEDFAALKHEDFAVEVGNVPDRGAADAHARSKAAEEKRQEYNRRMGQVAADLHERWERYLAGDLKALDTMSPDQITYLLSLSEQERRFGNRRVARSASISLAHELLGIRMFCKAAEQWLADRVVPKGYARREPKNAGGLDRTVHAVLSDLHLCADLRSAENPIAFGRLEQSRRLAAVCRQILEYKPQYRKRTRLMLHVIGDVIQGMLLHDMRDGAPLTEQMVVFWELMAQFVGLCAAEFLEVEIWFQPGNHGRDKLRHPGRATSFKWDGHEWRLYYALSMMCRQLKNVTCHLPFRSVSLIDVYGQTMGDSHGDTEIKLATPMRHLEANLLELQKINATQLYGRRVDAWNFGHFHFPMLVPGDPAMILNGALVPPDGHARSQGWISGRCGQWIYESVPGHLVGDARLVEVGPEQDADESLDAILTPPTFGASS